MLSRRGANMGYHIQAPRRSVSTFGFIFFLHLVCSVLADVPHHTDWQSYQDGKLGLQPNQTFHSAPHIGAPIYQVNKFNYEKVDKSPYIFLAGAYSEGLYGPSIISSEDLSLVWADERYSTGRATKPYIFKGQPVIAAYAGDRIRIYNQHYQQLYQVGWQLESPNRQGLNNHECYITEDDTVVIIFDEYTPADLTSLGGPAEGHGVIQQHVQEIDPVTNTVLFHFSTLNHFPVSSSLMPYWDNGGLFHDYSHMNSAQKTPEGDFLISIKHFGCIIMVNGKNAQPKWIMGGARNQFTDITKDGTATFGPQHHARISGKDRITLFDNAQWNNGFCEGRGSKGGHCSRGLELEYDLEAMTVWVVNEWYHPQGLISATRGGVQPLPNGNTLIAWGQNAMYTEHTPDGEVVMDIQRSLVDEDRLGHNTLIAYRAWKGDWEGKPTWGPNISANADASGNMTIYVSWNGATAVKRWVLLLSTSLSSLNGPKKVASESRRMGFETGFVLPRDWDATFARVAALNKNGEIIGSTPAVDIATGAIHVLAYEVSSVRVDEGTSANPKYCVSTVSSTAYGNIGDISSMPLYLACATSVGLAIALGYVLQTRQPSKKMSAI